MARDSCSLSCFWLLWKRVSQPSTEEESWHRHSLFPRDMKNDDVAYLATVSRRESSIVVLVNKDSQQRSATCKVRCEERAVRRPTLCLRFLNRFSRSFIPLPVLTRVLLSESCFSTWCWGIHRANVFKGSEELVHYIDAALKYRHFIAFHG